MSEGTARLCPVVWFEIYQGIRGMREEKIAEELAELCPLLPMDEACWSEAAHLGRAAKLGGLTCPMADVLIVACARRHGAEIVHDDKHIEALLKL